MRCPNRRPTASGERDFVSGFFHELVAIVLRYGILAAWDRLRHLGWNTDRRALSASDWMGRRHRVRAIRRRLVMGAAEGIPGVGVRMKAMASSSCHTE